MVTRIALGAALSAALARATASDASHEAHQQDPNDPRVWGFHLIPVLILSATVVLSLEIFDHTRVSRPLAATALAAMWAAALHEELQAASLLAALVTHGVREAHGAWTRGFPSLVQRDAASRFALRVFVWTAALATATQLRGTPQGALETLRATFFVALYSECAELLLTRYFSDKAQLTGYDWRRRVVPGAAALLVGALYASHALATLALWILRRVRPVMLALALVVGISVVERVDWSSAAASAERQARALVALVRNKIRPPTPKPRTGQRRSFLYRVGSDVEVVGAARHYEAYDFRHKHHEEDG